MPYVYNTRIGTSEHNNFSGNLRFRQNLIFAKVQFLYNMFMVEVLYNDYN